MNPVSLHTISGLLSRLWKDTERWIHVSRISALPTDITIPHFRVNLPRAQHHSPVGSHVQEVSLDDLESRDAPRLAELTSRDPPRLAELTSREGRQLIVSADRPPAAASRVANVRHRSGTGTEQNVYLRTAELGEGRRLCIPTYSVLGSYISNHFT